MLLQSTIFISVSRGFSTTVKRRLFIITDETANVAASVENNVIAKRDYFSITTDHNLGSQLQILRVENVFLLLCFLFIVRSFPLSFGFIRLPAVMFSHTGRCLWPLHKLQARVVAKPREPSHAHTRMHIRAPAPTRRVRAADTTVKKFVTTRATSTEIHSRIITGAGVGSCPL